MSVFGDTLDRTRIERNHSQRLVAEWVNDWLDTHDLDHELAELTRTATKRTRDQLEAVMSVIDDYRRRRPEDAANWHTTQAAVSKWVRRKEPTYPTPEKWLALAKYMELPLWEVYDMILRPETLPVTAPALRLRLEAVTAELVEAEKDNRALVAALERAEQRQRSYENDMARVTRRLALLEEALAGTELAEQLGISV